MTRNNSKGIISFTAVDGWNSVVKSMLTGAKTVESAKADLLDGEEVPLVQQPLRKASSVVYFHTEANPFGGWSAMKTQLEGEKRETILCRAYGVPVRQSRAVFRLSRTKTSASRKNSLILRMRIGYYRLTRLERNPG